MRKSEREIKALDDKLDVLIRCDTIRLGINDGSHPYILPLSFGCELSNGKISIYVHGAKEGKKIDLLAKNNEVFVEADMCHRFVDIGHSVTCEYESIMGWGFAEMIIGEEAKKGLELLLEHCGFEGHPYNIGVFDKMTIFKITLEEFVGKRISVRSVQDVCRV